jgi:hypothetical protein
VLVALCHLVCRVFLWEKYLVTWDMEDVNEYVFFQRLSNKYCFFRNNFRENIYCQEIFRDETCKTGANARGSLITLAV